jgi:hypothetical protein
VKICEQVVRRDYLYTHTHVNCRCSIPHVLIGPIPPSRLRHLKTFPPANVIHNHPPQPSKPLTITKMFGGMSSCLSLRFPEPLQVLTTSQHHPNPRKRSSHSLRRKLFGTSSGRLRVLSCCTSVCLRPIQRIIQRGIRANKVVTQRRIWLNTCRSFFR